MKVSGVDSLKPYNDTVVINQKQGEITWDFYVKKEGKMKGLEMKYFVLKPATKKVLDPYAMASRIAILAYAKAIKSENKELSSDLYDWILRIHDETYVSDYDKVEEREIDKAAKSVEDMVVNTIDLIQSAYTGVADGETRKDVTGPTGQVVKAYKCGTIIRIDIKEE